jgi:transglutaminase-like putative cysteine protease
MILTVNHETVYRYDAAVAHSTQYLRLTPQDGEGQRVLEWRLELPTAATLAEDGFGNILHVLTLDMPHSEIRIRATGIVETEGGERMSFDGGDPRPYLRRTPLTLMSGEMVRFAEAMREAPVTLAALDRLAAAVQAWMVFEPGVTHSGSSAAEAFAGARGVCQDHAHVFIACCRHLGVPARYVSGYVHSPGHVSGHMATHAWAEAWVGDRWWSFDVVNGCRAGASHLKLAVGMDYMDACPVRGVRRGGGSELMLAEVRVMPAQGDMSPEHVARMVAQQQQQQ